MNVVERIFRYIKGIINYGLWYSRSKEFTLTTCRDADWERNVDDKKSTSSVAFILSNFLVSWLSKKHTSISLFTVEVEYIAATTCCTRVLYMKQTFKNIKIEYAHPILIMCDHTSVINISKYLVMHSKTNLIPIKYHFLRYQVVDQIVRFEYVSTKEQLTKIFTKPLPG